MGARLRDVWSAGEVMPRVGKRQLERLQQVVDRCRSVVDWDGTSTVPDVAAAVLVRHAAHAARMEMLVASLHENAIVILPHGENPAFDGLKARLHAHGSLGAEGAEAPHQIWWGGVKPPAVPTGMYRKEETLFVSCYNDSTEAYHAALLKHDLQRLGLDHVVLPTPRSGPDGAPIARADFIRQQWEAACRPVFWLNPRTRVTAHPLLPQALGCDVALHRARSGAVTTGALFFHQTEHARELLDIWQRLTCSHGNLPDSFLLDQAWTMTSAQRQIETAWLPDSYWQVDDGARGAEAVIHACDASAEPHPLADYAVPLQAGRRFCRPGAPEAVLVMRSRRGGNGLISVLIRDVLAASAADTAASIEAAASAFAADSGGFAQMEVVLCGWNEDIDSVLQIEDHSWVLISDPSERVQRGAFGALAYDLRKTNIGKPEQTEGAARLLSLVDPALGARIKRSGTGQALVQRPA